MIKNIFNKFMIDKKKNFMIGDKKYQIKYVQIKVILNFITLRKF